MTPLEKQLVLDVLDALNLAIVSRGVGLRKGDREKFERAVQIVKALPEGFDSALDRRSGPGQWGIPAFRHVQAFRPVYDYRNTPKEKDEQRPAAEPQA